MAQGSGAAAGGDSLAAGGMVDIGPFAIDRYEYPNELGAMPAVNVSWLEAAALCAACGKRLCTEAEWQTAAAGPGNLLFGYGDAFDGDRCNTPYLAGGVWRHDRGTAASGSFAGCSSGYGVHDMIGNVWEWVADTLAASPDARTVRGGSWFNSANMARADVRYERPLPAGYRLDLIGFRCCRTVGPADPAAER